MGELAVVIGLAIVVYGIYSLFELFVRRKERMTIIDKIVLGESTDPVKLPVDLFKKESRGWTIRIGCLLLGAGLGMGIVSIIDIATVQMSIEEYAALGKNANWTLRNSPHYLAIKILYPASVIFFGGLGLIISYFVERKLNIDIDKKD